MSLQWSAERNQSTSCLHSCRGHRSVAENASGNATWRMFGLK